MGLEYISPVVLFIASITQRVSALKDITSIFASTNAWEVVISWVLI